MIVPEWISAGNMPFSSVAEKKVIDCDVVCPVTGVIPDTYLFSSWDTRFGEKGINHIFYSTESGLAVTSPQLAKDELNNLYRRHYSNPQPKIIFPDKTEKSPFKSHNKSKLLTRLINSSLWSGPKKICWDDLTCDELLAITQHSFDKNSTNISFLDVGCFDGVLLQKLKKNTRWQLIGVEQNDIAAQQAREKGLDVYTASAENAGDVINGKGIDIIFLGQTIEHLINPLQTVQQLRDMLNPGGQLIVSTPNLYSSQIDLFGPTWSHWHPPYHRFIFSIDSLKLLGEKVGLKCHNWKSYSHPYWSALSLQLNDIGLGGAVPHGLVPPKSIMKKAEKLVFFSNYLWNCRGGGDYIYMAFEKK